MIPRHIPDALVPQPGPQGVNPNRYETSEPAPMGVTDYGIGPSGPYEYASNATLGKVEIVSLRTQSSTGDPTSSIQLNVNLVFTNGGRQYVYWVQDVMAIDTSALRMYFEDNIWNSSSSRASMSASGVSGSGQVYSSNGQGYYAALGNSRYLPVTFPAYIQLLVTSDQNSFGQPTVTFYYDSGSGLVSYDTVTFVKATNVDSLSGFEVNGFNYNPDNLFFDSELVLCGNANGAATADIQSDVRLGLFYFNGHNYQSVPNSYNFGSDTAESISNVQSQLFHYTATGGLVARIQAGSGSLAVLYQQTQTGTIDIKTGLTPGTLYISNATYPGATPDQVAYAGGEVTVTLAPGSYLVQLYQGGTLSDQATESLAAGQSLQLQTPLGAIRIQMNYIVQGGGAGFAPVLSYTQGGSRVTVALGTSPTTYLMDPGTVWSVSGNQSGVNERWVTVQPTSGTASSYQSIQLTFFHQLLVTFSFATSTSAGQGQPPPAPPTIQYVTFGSPTTTSADSAVWVDSGATYEFTSPIMASSSERWGSPQAIGTVSSPGTLQPVYYHQFALLTKLTFNGGLPPSAPVLRGTQFGSTVNVGLNSLTQTTWLDSGTSWNVTNPTQGSNAAERWQSSSVTSGSAGGASTMSLAYYHQLSLTLGYALTGGGNPAAPVLTGRAFGVTTSAMLGPDPTRYFLDFGSNWTLPASLEGGTSTERWTTTQPVSGTVSASPTGASTTMTYDHQFLVEVHSGPPEGGTVSNSSGWFGNGTLVQLSATANDGWELAGWIGTGSGAYSGQLGQATIQVNGPVSESATFYPGLKITSGEDGAVTYSYGATSGTVAPGTSDVIFAPAGTVVSITANPTSFLYSFGTWSPASTGTSSQGSVALESPSSVQASFSLNVTIVGGLGAAGIAAAVAVALTIRRRSGAPQSA